MVQYSAAKIDELIAPKCSSLIECHAPELPEPPNYLGSFFLNNLFIDAPDPQRPMCIVFLRWLAAAFNEYCAGRQELLSCVTAQRYSNHMIAHYIAGLTRFESVIVNAYLALMAHNSVARSIDATSPRPFDGPQDPAATRRLNGAYNALKHFHGSFSAGRATGGIVAPVWVVNDGLEYLDGDGTHELLRFTEMADLLTDLSKDAAFLAEEVYREAHERAKAKAFRNAV